MKENLLEDINLDVYLETLRTEYLIPSRVILRNEIDKKFEIFKKEGITNVAELQLYLKKKIEYICKKYDIFDEHYLKVLLREINSIQPKPIKISEFTLISENLKKQLEAKKIKDTKKLIDYVKTKSDREKLADSLNVDYEEIEVVTSLVDLSRIRWVGVTFAEVLFQVGFESVVKVAKADYEVLYKTIKEFNLEKEFYKGQIGLNDMKLCVEQAKKIKTDIIL